MEAWESVIDSTNIDSFKGCLKYFECVCALWPLFIEYMTKTWLIPHKEKFVKA